MQPITVTASNATVGPVYSNWANFDAYALPTISIQADVTGVVNYTIQQTLDDPNSVTNPIPVANVTWLNHPSSNLVTATTAQQGTYAYPPVYARVVLNSGAGSVSVTFIQSGNVIQ